MEITVNIGDLDLSTPIGGDTVIKDYDGDTVERAPRLLGDAVVDALVAHFTKSETRRGMLADRIREIRDEVIREQISDVIAEALTGPIHPTNRFGEKVGEPTTLRAVIAEQAKEALKPRDGGYNKQRPLVQEIVAEEVGHAWKKELADTIAAEKAKVKQVVQASAAKLIADAVTKGLT